MATANQTAADLVARAAAARRHGDPAEARRLLEAAIAVAPDNPIALNSLGLVALAEGDTDRAIHYLERAVVADPGAPLVWLNLAEAQRVAGRVREELASLDRALAIDAYLLPALLKKAQAYERLGELARSAEIYRALLAATSNENNLPAPVRQALAHGRDVVRAEGARYADTVAAPLAALYEAYEGTDLSRIRTYAEHRAGRRQIFQQQPTGGHFPFLPAIEYFDRDCFPWFAALEDTTSAIRGELLALWAEEDAGFVPYVTFEATQPVNQWSELNHSPRWNAWFFWKDGVRQDANCARCPATAAAVEAVPLLDIPGKGPTVMFSILAPRTRIPPHTGSSNVRATVHLPLVVPDGCGFRVGGDTRQWQAGEAWCFDDTIEHEAWNDSDRPRAILILDVWNPLLTEVERAAVRFLG